jgi:hypothetical protein
MRTPYSALYWKFRMAALIFFAASAGWYASAWWSTREATKLFSVLANLLVAVMAAHLLWKTRGDA